MKGKSEHKTVLTEKKINFFFFLELINYKRVLEDHNRRYRVDKALMSLNI